MRVASFIDRAQLSPAESTALRDILAPQRTLADVLAWARTQTPPRVVAEIVTQDEYTHDVVIPLGARLILVYDTT